MPPNNVHLITNIVSHCDCVKDDIEDETSIFVRGIQDECGHIIKGMCTFGHMHLSAEVLAG